MLNSISTSTIEAIISRKELIDLLEEQVDVSDLVLISITDPVLFGHTDSSLSIEQCSRFKSFHCTKFWDVEEDFCEYKTISDELAKQLQEFIIHNITNRFIIHCMAGVSRSAGVGKAIECIKFFGIGDEAKYLYHTAFNSEISNHSRYYPNLVVFDKLVKEY